MSNKKYELTDEIIIICGRTLHRIRALRSFGDVITGVKKGDLGGFVEGEKSYQSNLNDPLLANLNKSMLMIEAA